MNKPVSFGPLSIDTILRLKTYKTIGPLKKWLASKKKEGKSIGFVPTMGALHKGHTSLVERAKRECDIAIVSIFVNPAQFNNASDLAHYPKTLGADIELLVNSGCDLVFVPAIKTIYPIVSKGHWDFGVISSVLEAQYRPGHFDGVLTIVKILFEIVKPHKAFFGEKDFQQLAIIRKWALREKPELKLVPCPTIREKDGLAMSSRNQRLNPVQRTQAANIFRILSELKSHKHAVTPEFLIKSGVSMFGKEEDITLEYLSLIDGDSFEPIVNWDDSSFPVLLVAAYVGEVRLIDNVFL